jgi:hypothetical protein
MSVDLKYISLNGVSLVPLEGEPRNHSQMNIVNSCAKARTNRDRRQNTDRRLELRFEENRRANQDRRPLNTWEKGRNL